MTQRAFRPEPQDKGKKFPLINLSNPEVRSAFGHGFMFGIVATFVVGVFTMKILEWRAQSAAPENRPSIAPVTAPELEAPEQANPNNSRALRRPLDAYSKAKSEKLLKDAFKAVNEEMEREMEKERRAAEESNRSRPASPEPK